MDWTALLPQIVVVLVPIVTMALVAGVRKLIPKIPRVALPVIAAALGAGLDLLVAYTTGGTFTPVIGALLGAAATWLREVISTLREHGLSS